MKLLIGLGVASAAVAMQDQLPAVQRRGATMLSQAVEAGPIAQLKGHAGAISGTAFANDGKWIVSAAADGTIKVWDAASAHLIRTLELDSGPATALATRERRAISGHKDGSIALWDLESGDRLATFKRNEARIWAVTFLGDQDHLAAASHDWAIALFDSRSPSAPTHVMDGHENAVQAIAYSTEGPLLASGSADRTVKLWNPATFDLVRTYRGHNDFVTAVALSPTGRTLASASLDGAIRFWSTSSHRTYRVVHGHKSRVTALAYSLVGRLLASASEDGTVVLWDAQRGRQKRIVHCPGGEVLDLDFAPDGRRLVTGSSDGIVRVWEAGTTRPAS